MPEDPLADIANRIEEQTREIRRLQNTVIWSVFFGTGAVLLALLRPQLLGYLLALGAVLALATGIVCWGSSTRMSRTKGRAGGGSAFIFVGIILALLSVWLLHL